MAKEEKGTQVEDLSEIEKKIKLYEKQKENAHTQEDADAIQREIDGLKTNL